MSTIITKNTTVICRGSKNPSYGHPKVYINTQKDGRCPYCSQEYKYNPKQNKSHE
ncbi:zinc-finger domain-containing protein [Candidatus Comchoanobacter bicostacola]|uniref:zinc-finger domain-containing protein n=1 Tax=Candidatus Comchoanobacter bicostacola TaxID=2919598 RepID=UPI003CCD6122